MKVTMLLCDSAQVADGKLFILGGGWSFVGPDAAPMAIAIKLDVPWTDGNQTHHWVLELTDQDGMPVWVTGPQGNQALVVEGDFQAFRPDDLRPGTPLDVPLVVNFGPVPLPSGSRYVWKFSVDGESDEDWQVGFTTRELK